MEYAAFGSALRKRREAFLFELGNPKNVLILGDGDGRFLQSFAALYPQAQIDAIDLSPKMIALAKARVPTAKFHHADARTFPFDKPYDLAVAHFFFDCLTQPDLDQLVARIQTKSWLVSEFRPSPLVTPLYLFFRLTTGLKTTKLPDHHAALKSFHLKKQKSTHLLTSELWILENQTHTAYLPSPDSNGGDTTVA